MGTKAKQGKKQWNDELFEKVLEIPAEDLLTIFGGLDLIPTGTRKYKAYCPFHSDKHLGNFRIDLNKGVCKCFACGEGGRILPTLMKIKKMSFVSLVFEIGTYYGLLTEKQQETFILENKKKERAWLNREKEMKGIKEETKKKRVSPDLLDKVYRIFIQEAGLSEEDRTYLLEARQLTEEAIKKGNYFTYPSLKETARIVKVIRQTFQETTDDVLAKIPGFFQDKQNRWLYPPHQGIGIGTMDAFGKIVGIQIRRTNPTNDQPRYTWFSSSFATEGGNDRGFTKGTSVQAPIEVVVPKQITSHVLVITEGHFKAEAVSRLLGCICLSIPGVTAWKDIHTTIQMIQDNVRLDKLLSPTLVKRNGKRYKPQAVYIAFDADFLTNMSVYKQMVELSKVVKMETKLPTYYLIWKQTYGKGIDDVLLSKNEKKIFRYESEKINGAYQQLALSLKKKDSQLLVGQFPKETIQAILQPILATIQPIQKAERKG